MSEESTRELTLQNITSNRFSVASSLVLAATHFEINHHASALHQSIAKILRNEASDLYALGISELNLQINANSTPR